MTTKRKKLFAFSLVELMAALAVIMVLVTLALPRYRVFIATSRQAEAQSNLGIIAKLQQTYQLKYIGKYYANSNFKMGQGSSDGTCGNNENSQQNELGFRVSQCSKLRYTYYTPNGPNPPSNATIIGEAKKLWPWLLVTFTLNVAVPTSGRSAEIAI